MVLGWTFRDYHRQSRRKLRDCLYPQKKFGENMNNTTKIINCCPHPVTVFVGAVYDPNSGGYTGGYPIICFTESGCVATAKSSVKATEPLVIAGEEVPACNRRFTAVTPLPKADKAMYIVSSLYAQAVEELGMDTSRLLTPNGDVYTECGHKVGCTSLVRYEKKV